jgi:murein DD-endopeptidase MepM/ murein hydrolase activator NlpD
VPLALAATAVGLLAGGAAWWTSRAPTPPTAEAAPARDAGEPTGAAAPDPTLQAAPAAVPAPAPEAPVGPLKTFSAVIRGPLESALIAAAGRDGVPLAQVVTRTLVWWLRVPKDLGKGDAVAAVYELRHNQEPLLHAVRFTSVRLGKRFEAWRYQPPGAPFARFYQTDGSELEERLVDAPLDAYEQITSLLKDGRRHRGVDFKAPVGTPVRATFDGRVSRKTWNFRSNGNSVEVVEQGGQGRTAMFLHLSEVEKDVAPGRPVKKGQVIARSGNTGHSFAPHLHYQLMKGEQVIDPFQSHETTRASLPPEARAGFEAEVARLRALLP